MRDILCGKNRDRMPGLAFRLMALWFGLRDRIAPPAGRLDRFGILSGQTVVDYGCGTGSYLSRASERVGEKGTVYAVDIQPLAIAAVRRRILKENLSNVRPLLTDGNRCPLTDGTADIIYALDMFHMVSDARAFLRELHRIAKPHASLFLDDGHQKRQETRAKVLASGLWEILGEEKDHLHLRPRR